MYADSFETEAKLRREIAALQEKIAGLMEIQVRAELYREKVLREFKELETENDSLRVYAPGANPHLPENYRAECYKRFPDKVAA